MEKKKVTVRNLTIGDGIMKICIPVTARTSKELKEQIKIIKNSPCEMVELRTDYFEEDPLSELKAFREKMPEMPLLFTYRTKEEGGEGPYDPETYARLNLHAAASELTDFVDLEINRGESLIKELMPQIQEKKGKVILSYHDFSGTPSKEELVGLFSRMFSLGADIPKVAVMARSEQDVMTLLLAAQDVKEHLADRPYIVLSMGEAGRITRLAGSLTGTDVTFATAGASSAPGQMEASFVELCRQKI